MEIRVTTNAPDLVADFGAMQRKQAPFANRLALKRTIEEARDEVRARIFRGAFQIRTPQARNFIINAVGIERPAASGQRPDRDRFLLRVDSKVGTSKSRALLPWLEEGGLRRSPREIGPPGFLGRTVAMPIRENPADVIQRALYPANLRLQASAFAVESNAGQRRPSGILAGRLKGKRRTFVLPLRGSGRGFATIFQRVGTGKKDLKALFRVRPHVPVAGRRFFFDVAERVIRERFPINFRGALQAALFSSEIGVRRDVVGARWRRGGYEPIYRRGGAPTG